MIVDLYWPLQIYPKISTKYWNIPFNWWTLNFEIILLSSKWAWNTSAPYTDSACPEWSCDVSQLTSVRLWSLSINILLLLLVSEIAICIALNIVLLWCELSREWQKGREAGLTSAWQEPTVRSLSLTGRGTPDCSVASEVSRQCGMWLSGFRSSRAHKATCSASFLLVTLPGAFLSAVVEVGSCCTHTHWGCIWISSPLNNPAPN